LTHTLFSGAGRLILNSREELEKFINRRFNFDSRSLFVTPPSQASRSVQRYPNAVSGIPSNFGESNKSLFLKIVQIINATYCNAGYVNLRTGTQKRVARRACGGAMPEQI
jgi:hypothetical protein